MGALPRSGGVLDQDSFFIYMLNVYEVAMHERQELEDKRARAKQQRLRGRH